MPLIGFSCERGKQVSFKECLSECTINCLPLMIRISIIKTLSYRGTMISATTLTGCLRKNYWERTVNYYANPTTLIYAAWRGKFIHEILETVASPLQQSEYTGIELDILINKILKNYIFERRFSKILKFGNEEVEISGQIDCYNFETATLSDYKTCPESSMQYLTTLRESHVEQLQIYKFLLSPLPVKKMELHYISMRNILSTGRTGIIQDGKIERVIHVPDIPIMDDEDILKNIIAPRTWAIHCAFSRGIVPEGKPNSFYCNSCPFTEMCQQIETKKR